VIAGLILLAILVAAYRSLGRHTAPVRDPRALLTTVLDTAAEAERSLRAPEDAAERSVQRQLEGCAQTLELIEESELSDALVTARRLLAQGVGDLLWAARLAERSGLTSAGLRDGFDALHAGGARCLDEVRAALAAASAAPEVVDRPG